MQRWIVKVVLSERNLVFLAEDTDIGQQWAVHFQPMIWIQSVKIGNIDLHELKEQAAH